MANFIFYDFETSSSNKYWGQIIQIGAILTNDNFEELDRFDARCRLNPGIIPEAMALIVNKSTPKLLKNSNLSHYEMTRQFVETLKKWGKATYIGFNSIEFDEEFLRCTLFQTLEYPYLTSTNQNSRGDILSLARAANLYYPNTLKNSINEKGNAVYKLDQLAPINGIEHGDAAHSAIGDVIATIGIAKIIANKAPNVWKASMLTLDKTQSLELIKKENFFCTNEYFYGKSRPYVQTFVCQHPKYKWPLCFDLKQDPNIFLNMSIKELASAMKKNPKFLRTVRHNKHPVIMNPSYGNTFEEYKVIGLEKLADRAKLIKDNKEFANKVSIIKQEEAEEKEQSKSQEDVYNEESINSFINPEDNKLMPEFHKVDWDKKLIILSKFKDERLKYFGKKLLYMEKPEVLSKSDYNLIHKETAKKLLSTNNEKWNTIPRTYSEIDTLRDKFTREEQPEKLVLLDEINAYVEELEKLYSSV
jgi:exodeoxyribonuclease I